MELPTTVALITGAAGSLGKVVAVAMSTQGFSLALPVRTKAQAELIANDLHLPTNRLLTGIVDLTEEGAVAGFVRNAEHVFGALHILVNCAGGYAGGKLIEDVTATEWDHLMVTNLRSAFLTCKAALPAMKRAGWGRIVNIAAASALNPGSRRGPYQVSKRGVITLTETIAEETRGTGITANAIAPSTILTEANRASMPTADTSLWTRPEEIAAQILSLCATSSHSVTGNTIRM
jgi:NAD(P)-dependent dehydrogenase (short-subunit alcohol dehydrogenase family)